MIENVSIFTKSGLVLWEHKEKELDFGSVNPIDNLVMDIFLEEKMHINNYEHGGYIMNWTLENEKNLVFVLVYKSSIKAVSPKYYMTLLETVKSDFNRCFAQLLQHRDLSPYLRVFHGFGKNYTNIIQSWTQTVIHDRKKKRSGESMRGFKKKEKSKQKQEDAEELDRERDAELLRLKSQRRGKKKMRTYGEGKGKKKGKKPKKGKQAKVGRVWGANMEGIGKFTDEKSKELQKGPIQDQDSIEQKKQMAEQTGVNEVEKVDLNISSEEEGEEEEEEEEEEESNLPEANKNKPKKGDEEDDEDSVEVKKKEKKGMFGKFFSSLSGKRKLEKDDLRPVMRMFRNHLVSKNVAEDVSQKICDSVQQSLLGKNMGRISTVHRIVKNAMQESLTRILSPTRPIRIKKGIMECKDRKEPYSMVFCGVNGVGKSTSLAKIAFWLKGEGFSVIICACDTFRSGAVEQLKKHAECLEVPLFQRGYGKDAYSVAREGVQYARANEIDVVLIDTAGRMQSNEPLMVSLGKLIEVNKPELVLFVGEALVGNQGVEQLVKFDEALKKYSKSKGIDGILLTKFDTIDDKVGAAISMVYISSHPIVFIGTGQKYYHLKKLAPKNVVDFMLK